jgi:hypothetical protein
MLKGNSSYFEMEGDSSYFEMENGRWDEKVYKCG